MRYIIVYHISFSSENVLILFFIHLASCRTAFFSLVLGKWRSTLMKHSCYCWSRPEQSSELPQIWAHRPCWVRERVSAGKLHLYTINPCTAIYPPFSCRCPRYFPATSVWGTADWWWWVTQIHSAWGSPPATLLLSLPRLCCLPQASSCAILFLFHRFFQLLKLEVGVLFKKHANTAFETPLGREFSNIPLGLEVLGCYFLVVKMWGFVCLLFWAVYGGLFVWSRSNCCIQSQIWISKHKVHACSSGVQRHV